MSKNDNLPSQRIQLLDGLPILICFVLRAIILSHFPVVHTASTVDRTDKAKNNNYLCYNYWDRRTIAWRSVCAHPVDIIIVSSVTETPGRPEDRLLQRLRSTPSIRAVFSLSLGPAREVEKKLWEIISADGRTRIGTTRIRQQFTLCTFLKDIESPLYT